MMMVGKKKKGNVEKHLSRQIGVKVKIWSADDRKCERNASTTTTAAVVAHW